MAHTYVHITDEYVSEKGILLDAETQDDVFAPQICYVFATNQMHIKRCKADCCGVYNEEEFIIDFNEMTSYVKITEPSGRSRIERVEGMGQFEEFDGSLELDYIGDGYDCYCNYSTNTLLIVGYADDKFHYDLKEFFERRA